MALSENQKNNVHKLDNADLVDLLYTCIDALCVVDRVEYCNIMGLKGISRQTYYDMIKSKKINIIEMPDGRKYPYIN